MIHILGSIYKVNIVSAQSFVDSFRFCFEIIKPPYFANFVTNFPKSCFDIFRQKNRLHLPLTQFPYVNIYFYTFFFGSHICIIFPIFTLTFMPSVYRYWKFLQRRTTKNKTTKVLKIQVIYSLLCLFIRWIMRSKRHHISKERAIFERFVYIFHWMKQKKTKLG